MTKRGKLDGKVALVTGGSRGIGKAIALRMAKEGADVVINYSSAKGHAEKVSKMIDHIGTADKLDTLHNKINDVDSMEDAKELTELIENLGSHSYISQADVSNVEDVNRMQDDVINQFGKVDILINNAGITRDKSFAKMTPAMWRDVLSVNLDGTFYCTKAFIGGMLERKYGRIVNISSVIGRMGSFGQANYTASKAGMIGLTKSLAKEYARKGITVNAIAPGFIETDMVRAVPPEFMKNILAQIPLGRLGQASEVAGAVAYLVSEDGEYITGQVIDVNGGLYI